MISPTPYSFAAAITPHDSTDITLPGSAVQITGIYVGGAGNFVAVFKDGSTATFTGALAGHVYPLTNIKRINSTNTTATALLALYRM